VRDCQRIFGQALHVDKARVSYVFNHPLPAAGLSRVQFETALEQPIALEIPHAGESVSKVPSLKGSRPARQQGHSRFGQAIDDLARELQPPEAREGATRAAAGAGSGSRSASGVNRLLRRLRGDSH
jgi:hypothetical protein